MQAYFIIFSHIAFMQMFQAGTPTALLMKRDIFRDGTMKTKGDSTLSFIIFLKVISKERHWNVFIVL